MPFPILSTDAKRHTNESNKELGSSSGSLNGNGKLERSSGLQTVRILLVLCANTAPTGSMKDSNNICGLCDGRITPKVVPGIV